MLAQQIPVEVGRFEGDGLEIVGGLTIESRVIAAGMSCIREGMLVKPMVKERGL